MKQRVGFIGAGNMAGAIIQGILKGDVFAPQQIAVYARRAEVREKYEQMGIAATDSAAALAASCDVVFLSVKPQNYEEILGAIKDSVDESKVIVSIAAGISTNYIKKMLGFDCKVVRAMPNTPLLLSLGATALCRVSPVTQEEFDLVSGIFASAGIVCELPEEKMNAVISVSGSSPAYVYLFAKAVVDGAAEQGIDPETAKELFCKTLIGSAQMILKSGQSLEDLIRMVASPGGTTLKALEALREDRFEDAVKDAMRRCTARAEELGR